MSKRFLWFCFAFFGSSACILSQPSPYNVQAGVAENTVSSQMAVGASSMPKKFILITSLYNETSLARVKEYIYCLEKNLKHPSIERVHVIYDTSSDTNNMILFDYLRARGVKIDFVGERPTYDYCFNLANRLYSGKRVILANADIYFNETLNVLENYDFTNKFMALTRWNMKSDGSLEIFKQYKKDGSFEKRYSESSQDAWIFKAPIKNFSGANIQMGSPLCDPKIAYQALKSGFTVVNPCLSVQCCHVHLSDVRHYRVNLVELSRLYGDVLWSVAWSAL